ncbi:unnamed protein product [Periconia digitata]|uniref:Uncharacterized protein n=1 Tax=Periconia digitata TaxID=1303443 RepID=A0A9W4XT97_9PLEO|nr:unnamed protein product [Periconia digitata]
MLLPTLLFFGAVSAQTSVTLGNTFTDDVSWVTGPTGATQVRARETSTSSSSSTTAPPTTLGYYSNDETAGTPTVTVWAPVIASTAGVYYVTSQSNYWRQCSYYVSSSTFTITSLSSTSRSYSSSFMTTSGTYSCPIWTDCQAGTLSGIGVSPSFCQNGPSRCMTYTLFDSWSGTPTMTSLGCYTTTNSQEIFETAIYQKKPESTGLTKPATSTPPAEGSSDTPPPPAAPPATNNTSAIAGGVVGGLAVLAIAGVAVFWILRRSKRRRDEAAAPLDTNANTGYDPYLQNPQAPTGYYQPTYQHDKPELQGDVQAPIYEAPPNAAGYVVPPSRGQSPNHSAMSTSPVPPNAVGELPTSPGAK